MNFLDTIKERAKNDLKKIVLPEATDIRTLKATEVIIKEGLAKIILVGDKKEILKKASGLDISNADIINPKAYKDFDNIVQALVELRKEKGMTTQKAYELLQDPIYFGVMLTSLGIADGMVAGATHYTADVLRPSLQILKTAPNTKIVSSFFIMVEPNANIWSSSALLFADCGLNQNPDAEQLAHIAISSARSYKGLVGKEPMVAMLSHSTKGSAKHSDVDKVVSATKIAKEHDKSLIIDGELQLDAAIDLDIASKKAENSPVAGKANVLIFPDLDSGNIGYKLVERLAKAQAFGPITQGIAKPVNDLSRGCSFQDIVGVVAITAVQAQQS